MFHTAARIICYVYTLAVLFFSLGNVTSAAPVNRHAAQPAYNPLVFPSADSKIGYSVSIVANGQGAVISPMQSTAIGQLYRTPAGLNRQTELMEGGNIAYYRDAFTMLTFTATATTDGDYWDIKDLYMADDGNGGQQEEAWPTLTYYRQLNGVDHCFNSPGWLYPICGSQSIFIYAWHDTQCHSSGNWTRQVLQGQAGQPSTLAGEKSFTLKLEVPPNDPNLAVYRQQTFPGQLPYAPYDSICRSTSPGQNTVHCERSAVLPPELVRNTIFGRGCALTSAAMVIRYHGANVGQDQGLIDFDQYLLNTGNGYTNLGGMNWITGGVDGFAASRGATAKFMTVRGNNPQTLREDICKYGPQVMGTKLTATGSPRHFVMAVGRTQNSMTQGAWKIHDPAGGVITDLGVYANQFSGTRIFRGAEVSYPFPIYGIVIKLYSPAELLLTAPDGRKTGLDPATGVVLDEIPNSAYQAEGYDDLELNLPADHFDKWLTLLDGPADGSYGLQVMGTANGTYSMEIQARDANGVPLPATVFKDIPTQAGLIHHFVLQYDHTMPAPVTPTPLPTANAGVDLAVSEGASVTLNGSAAHPTGTIVGYAWSQTAGPAVTLAGAATAMASFVAPQVTVNTVLTFQLTVTDNAGRTAVDTVDVLVRDNPNTAPTANAGPDQTVKEEKKVKLNGSASFDADGQIVSYAWRQLSGRTVRLSDANRAIATFRAPEPRGKKAEILVFELKVTDNSSLSATDTVTFRVKDDH